MEQRKRYRFTLNPANDGEIIDFLDSTSRALRGVLIKEALLRLIRKVKELDQEDPPPSRKGGPASGNTQKGTIDYKKVFDFYK